MTTTPLAALNAVTPAENVGDRSYSVNVSGTFVGIVQFQRRTIPLADPEVGWQPIARDMSGNFVQFTGPSGDVPGIGVEAEPVAQVRAVMIAYTSGTANVRIGAL